jgi:DNA-binding response OmpR family regulator
MVRLLLVEDDRTLTKYVRMHLEDAGYAVSVCFDGASGLRAAETTDFDMLILDIMLPHLDGIQVAKRLRLQKISMQILMLTGRDSPADVVRGLDAGADDYLTKPFSFEVLLARIRARTRQSSDGPPIVFRFADLRLDTKRHEAWRGMRKLNLTPKEFAILECLIRCGGRIATRENISDAIWGDQGTSNNNLDGFMLCLRRKVDLPGGSCLIYTERGVGYRLVNCI